MGGCGSKPEPAAEQCPSSPPVPAPTVEEAAPPTAAEAQAEREAAATDAEALAEADAAADAAANAKAEQEAEADAERKRAEDEERRNKEAEAEAAAAKLASHKAKADAGTRGRCSWCLAEAHFSTRDRSDPLRWGYSCDVCEKKVLACLTCGDHEHEDERGMARDLGARGREDLCAVCDKRLPQKSWEDVPHNIQLSRAMARSP